MQEASQRSVASLLQATRYNAYCLIFEMLRRILRSFIANFIYNIKENCHSHPASVSISRTGACFLMPNYLLYIYSWISCTPCLGYKCVPKTVEYFPMSIVVEPINGKVISKGGKPVSYRMGVHPVKYYVICRINEFKKTHLF